MKSRKVACAILAMTILAILGQGCAKKTLRSENYFGLVPGNAWLFESDQESKIEVEMKITKPDPSLNLKEGILDLSISGSLGNLKIGEQGLFLEVSSDEVKLWGIREPGSPPHFFETPYIWLKKPIQIGQSFNTSIQGTESPPLMFVTGKIRVSTPLGLLDGFVLEDSQTPGGNTRLVFVEHFGFASATVPGLPPLKIKDAELN
ncbi:MAG: hypothetical protein PHP64_03865 [Actinomycetota bacterium]|nr:hypothetical protein [Actinomycetota bacterium]